jgi:hypothetical protein
MLRTRFASLALVLLSASGALAAAPPAQPAGGAVQLKAGDTVEFELDRLPDALEGDGLAICVGLRNSATGPVEATCERPFRFELPSGDAHMVFTFRGSTGRETPVELPVVRSSRPVTFVAPSDGSLLPPGPTSFRSEASDGAARKAAELQCGRCQGTGFKVESFKVTRSPIPAAGSLPVKFKVIRSAAPASK